jgi:hypothetical protein
MEQCVVVSALAELACFVASWLGLVEGSGPVVVWLRANCVLWASGSLWWADCVLWASRLLDLDITLESVQSGIKRV